MALNEQKPYVAFDVNISNPTYIGEKKIISVEQYYYEIFELLISKLQNNPDIPPQILEILNVLRYAGNLFNERIYIEHIYNDGYVLELIGLIPSFKGGCYSTSLKNIKSVKLYIFKTQIINGTEYFCTKHVGDITIDIRSATIKMWKLSYVVHWGNKKMKLYTETLIRTDDLYFYDYKLNEFYCQVWCLTGLKKQLALPSLSVLMLVSRRNKKNKWLPYELWYYIFCNFINKNTLYDMLLYFFN